MANERLRALEDVEKGDSDGAAVCALQRQTQRQLLDRQLVQFQSSVNRVENELSGQIRYLTQVKTGRTGTDV
ncbi:hypothetical protein INR49_007772 [Caranx melampygus]|nr:hypothetical protein INR49_007772 [Caranx melampygus]